MVNNKHVLITGCNQGIGRAIADLFFERGWIVTGLDITDKPSECAWNYIELDISKPAQVIRLADAFIAENRTINCLVNNAAIQIEKSLLDTSIDEWDRVMSTNLNGAFYMTKAFAPVLSGGSIVNISSVHARATSAGMCAYVTSKGGMSAFTRAAALELAPLDIRVNAILPGAVNTEMLKRSLSRSSEYEEAKLRLERSTPLGRIVRPEEIASLALFLANTDLSGSITGQEFVCDGGVLARLASE